MEEKIYIYFDQTQDKSFKDWFSTEAEEFNVHFSCFLGGYGEKRLAKYFTLSSKKKEGLDYIAEINLNDYATRELDDFIVNSKGINLGKMGLFTTQVQLENDKNYFDLVYISSIFPKDLSNLSNKWKYLNEVSLGKFLWELKP